MKHEYPERPIVGVGGVVFHEGKVLLVKRGKEPLYCQWSLPGGTLELGETLVQALEREILEEANITVKVEGVLEVIDRIFHDEQGRVKYHFVIIDYLCQYISGEPKAASDALEVEFVALSDLERYNLSPQVLAVIKKAAAKWKAKG